MAREGASCVVNYPAAVELGEADSLVEELAGLGVAACAIEADIADTAAVTMLMDQVIEQKRGNIINIASISAFIGRGNADYIASKSALLGLTRSLARQYGSFGIRANSISPGFHDSAMTRRASQNGSENADDFIKQVPLGFLADADSIGKAALFLASDDSYYITGHNLVVDGGLTLR